MRDVRLRLADLSILRDPSAHGIDALLDLRAPGEFAQDHLPGATNLPVLDDTERARVGEIYVQQSAFLARRIGAALVARNAARHLEGVLSDRPRRWRPLLYCWRGGQRSSSFAMILQQVGWPVRVLDGGYRAYRRIVAQMLYDRAFPAPVVVLDGDTGAGKTAVLNRLGGFGVQVLDLEDMARHRGSLFGRQEGGQPSQKRFESALALAMAGLDPLRPVVVEAESNRIGRILLPPALWQAMQTAPRLWIEAPLPARADRLVRTYGELLGDPAGLAARIETLRPWHSRAQIDTWLGLARSGALHALAMGLLSQHYDPRYRRSRAAAAGPRAGVLAAAALDSRNIEHLAEQVADWLADPETLRGRFPARSGPAPPAMR